MRRTCSAAISVLFCAIAVISTVPGRDPSAALLVQQALREAQECLQQDEPGTAVRVLESQLPHINGEPAYLELLSQAYERYVVKLRELGRTDMLATYLERLAILNPDRANTLRNQWQLPQNEKFSTRLVVRGRMDDEALFPEGIASNDLPRLADQAFERAQYLRARLHYWQAQHSHQRLSALQKQRWAYCTWQEIYHLLHRPASSFICWPVVLQEARQAIELAPEWPFARQLADEVERRVANYRVPVYHDPQCHGGWYVASSPHFRVYHQHANLAEQVLVVAEQTLSANACFWFGELHPPTWDVPCEIYLHPNLTSLAQSTGVTSAVHGFSTLTYDFQSSCRVVRRRMDLNAQAQDLCSRVVPHEATHVALAGRFGPRPLPRWADEGMALLAEPQQSRQFYRQKARLACQQRTALPLEKLLTLEEYPPQLDPSVFYGQSLLLVERLVLEKNNWTFVQFIMDAHRLGWEPALRRHYRWLSLQDLARSIWNSETPATEAQLRRLCLPLMPCVNFAAASQNANNGWNRN